MRYFFIGIFLSLIGALVSIVIWDIEMVTTVTSSIGFFFIGIALIFSGVFISGDRMRANFATESAKNKMERNNISFRSALMGMPSLVVAILFYFLLN
ncbi:hypothetical protein FOH38_18780 [Lysinibacillus fusiformis]|nr:hypothetical protein FOH38_18780 [Lysinibacillus fusiformis]